jgi:hypothetical protein
VTQPFVEESAGQVCWPPVVAQSLPYDVLIGLLLFLGRLRMTLSGVQLKPGRMISDLQTADALARGLVVLEDWPQAFDALMLDQASRGSPDSGLKGAFGHVYRRILREPDCSWGALLRSAFAEFLIRHPEISCLPANSFCRDVLVRRGWGYISMEQARRLLGLRGGEFRGLQLSTQWAAIEKVGIGTAWYVSEASVIALKAKLDDVVTLAELGQMIGIRHKLTLGKICEAEVFERAPEAAYLDGRAIAFSKSAAQTFLQRLSGGLDLRPASADLIDFNKAVRKAAVRGLDVADIMRLLWSGRLVPVARQEGVGLQAILFDEAPLAEALDELIARKLGSISIRTAAIECGMSIPGMYRLLKREKISLHQPAGVRKGVGLRIDRKELSRIPLFQKQLPTQPKI